MAEKYGFLLKRKRNSSRILEKNMWDQRFFVLCNIGLLYMKTPQDDKNISYFVA